MLFTSLDFFLFLAAALAVFACLPQRLRTAWLLIASAAFYGWKQPSHLAWLAAIALFTSACGAGLGGSTGGRARKAWLAAGVAVAAGSLAALKFHDFAAGEIESLAMANGLSLSLPRIGVAAPAGFSFYAFSAIALLVDLYRREFPGGVKAGQAALYLAWFPKILAGPIERATAFLPKLRGRIAPTPEQVVLGAQLVGWGLVKKVVIADNLAPVVDRAFGIAAFASPVDLAVAVYFFAFQIYCDFSGYTDIAIGVSLLFGIGMAENFRRPYFSRSTSEFWSRRWHISLATWFRDYLYIPLGGSRAGAARRYLNLMLVFMASGLWHAGLGYGVGWTFLVWGALNGFYVCAGAATRGLWQRVGERLPRLAQSRAWAALRIALTFHLILLGWVFFRAKSLGDAWIVLRKIGTHLAELPQLAAHYAFNAEQTAGAALIALLLAIEWLDERKPVLQRLAGWPVAARWATCYAALAVLVVMGRWQAREFIYMQF